MDDYENKEYNSKIYDDGDGDKIFQCFPIKGELNTGLSFNVTYLNEDKYEWFCEVVGRQIYHMVIGIENQARNSLQSQLKSLLGVVDPRI